MKSVQELFDGEAERKQTFMNDLWMPFSFGLTGFGMVCFMNWTTRRPVFSGLQKHALFTGLGAVIGKYADGWRQEYLSERDAVLRHYISLHPEDFPLPDRKKFSEVLRPWVPIR